MGLHCRCGSQWDCAAFVAAYGALPYWQPRGLCYRYGSQASCVTLAAEMLHCRRDNQEGGCAAGLSVKRHCKSGSQWVCLISVAAYGGIVMAVMWWQPMRLRCRCGTQGLR